MDVPGIRTALAQAAATISGLRGNAYLVDSINPPCWVSGEVDITYNRTFKGGASGLAEGMFTGRLYVSRADDRAGQALLDSYLGQDGAASVKAAIETDLTLGGVCKQLIVERVHGYAIYTIAGTDYLGAKFDVRVWG